MQRKWSPIYLGVLVATAGLVVSGGLCAPAQAAPKANTVGRQPWPAKRVVLVLPLQLGENWNSDRNAGALLLPQAQDRLHEALVASGKFSIVEAHRFNPIFGRAVQDKLATQEQLDELINNPSLESARQILSGMTFMQQPLIADFRLEEVRMGGTAKRQELQVQVSGRLYEVTNPVAVKAVVVTSNPVHRSKSTLVLDTAVAASADAFQQIVAQFVAPLPDIEFTPTEPAPTVPAPIVAPEAPPVAPTPLVVPLPPAPTSTLPGGGFAGASSAGSPFPMPVMPRTQP